MKVHINLQAMLLGLAALVLAWGAIYRGLVRPLVRAMRRLSDELAAFRETTLMVREVVQYVAGFVVHTDERLEQLERAAGLAPPAPPSDYHLHRRALEFLERNAELREQRRRTDEREDAPR